MLHTILAVLLYLTPPQEIQHSTQNIVKVDRHDLPICTGFIVNVGKKYSYVLTARHCRDDKTPKDDGFPTTIQLADQSVSIVNRVYLSQGEDLILLQVDRLPRNGFTIADAVTKPGGQYYTISHPTGYEYIYSPIIGANTQSGFNKDGSVDYDNAVSCLTCQHGTSGAPVLLDSQVYGILLAKSSEINSLLFTTSSHKISQFLSSLGGKLE